MLADGGTDGLVAIAFGVGLTGLFSLVAWLVLQISDLKEKAASNRSDIENLDARVNRLDNSVYTPAWGRQPEPPPMPPIGPSRR